MQNVRRLSAGGGGCYRLHCVLRNAHVEVLNPVSENVTVCGDRDFKEVAQLK